MWIVLSGSEVIESRYKSAFDGEVQITPLLDTVYGLLQKSAFVTDPISEANRQQKTFFIRRFWPLNSPTASQNAQSAPESTP